VFGSTSTKLYSSFHLGQRAKLARLAIVCGGQLIDDDVGLCKEKLKELPLIIL
jgi:hypothetical protein